MAETWDMLAVLIQRGGPVMVALLALSVVAFTLMFERIWFWLGMARAVRRGRLARLNNALRKGDVAAAKALIQRDPSVYSDVARRLVHDGASEAVAVEAVEAQRPRLERFMVSLSTIVTAAPLLGILGTVIGIIQSFRLLGAQTTLSDPRDVSAGIATALLTTALGLIVALVVLFPYMLFRGQVDRAIGRLESLIAAAQQGLPIDVGKPTGASRTGGGNSGGHSGGNPGTSKANKKDTREYAPSS